MELYRISKALIAARVPGWIGAGWLALAGGALWSPVISGNDEFDIEYEGITAAHKVIELQYLGDSIRAWGNRKKGLYAYCVRQKESLWCASSLHRAEIDPDLIYERDGARTPAISQRARDIAKELQLEEYYSRFIVCKKGCDGADASNILIITTGE